MAFLDRAAQVWLAWMWTMSWQVALMGGVILAVALLARKTPPRFRYFLWCLVLLKLCLPPNLAFVTGLAQWVLPRQVAVAPAVANYEPISPVTVRSPAAVLPEEAPVPRSSAARESAPPTSVAPVPARKAAWHVSWPMALFGAWSLGAAALLALFAIQHRRMARLLASAQPVVDLAVLRALDEARNALGIRRRVALVSIVELHSPILFGLFRPRIVLPRRALESLPADQIRPILLHELAHLRRRDLWMGFVQLLAQVAYWFHPVVWLANRQLRRERELIVDDIVLAKLEGGRESYSASLLSIVQQGARQQFFTPSYVGIVETPGSLAQRLKRILDTKRRLSVRLGWAAALLLIALGLALIPMGRARAAAPNEPPAFDKPLLQLGSSQFRQEDPVRAVAFSPDGTLLASGGYDNGIYLWDASTGEIVRKIPKGNGYVESMTFSRDGKLLYTGGSSFDVWDVTEGTHKATYWHKSETSDPGVIAVSPDEKWVATGRKAGDVCLWEAAAGKLVKRFQWHQYDVCALAFSPNGARLASMDSGGNLCIWEVGSTKDAVRVKAHERAGALAFSRDSRMVFTGGEKLLADRKTAVGQILGWNPETGDAIGEMKYDEKDTEIVALALSPDGKLLASGAQDKIVRLWDAETWKFVRKLRGRRDNWGVPYSLAFSNDGKRLASGGNSNAVYVWDVESGKKLFPQTDDHETNVRSVVYGPDGKLIVSADSDGVVCFWNAVTGARVGRFDTGSFLYRTAISPDGKCLAACGFHMLKVYEVPSGALKMDLSAEMGEDQVFAVSFSSGGTMLAARCQSGTPRGERGKTTISIFEIPSGRILKKLEASSDAFCISNEVGFSRDDKTLWSAGDGVVELWDLKTGERISRLEPMGPMAFFMLPSGLTGGPNRVASLALSFERNLAVIGTMRNTIEIRQLAKGLLSQRVRFPGEVSVYSTVSLSNDGSMIAARGGTGRERWLPQSMVVHLLDTATGGELLTLTSPCGPAWQAPIFSPDGDRLATAMPNGRVLIWDIKAARSATPRPPAPPQAEDQELFIFDTEGQMGVMANRVFYDERGWVTKAILYVLKPEFTERPAPYTEEMLAPFRACRLQYDAAGRQVRTEEYTPDMKLVRVHEQKYDADSRSLAAGSIRDGEGRLQSAYRRSKDGSYTTFQYDVTGAKLIGVGGSLPLEADLSYGWGPEHKGLSCGLGVNTTSGDPKDMQLWITLKNAGRVEAKVVVGSVYYKAIQPELRDEEGTVVPPDAAYVARRSGELSYGRSGPTWDRGVPPGTAEMNFSPRALSDWYPSLPAGKYTLSFRLRTPPEEEFNLVSNAVPIVIEKNPAALPAK